MFDLEGRFAFGINLDDPWHYAGFREPKSIIIPHLLSVGLPEGRVLEEFDEGVIRAHEEVEPGGEAETACIALADNLRDLGVAFVRCWFPWRFFEQRLAPEVSIDQALSEGYADWPMDGLVDGLARAGISVVPVLACGYQRMLPDGLDANADPSLYLRRVAVHARLLTRHYKGRVKFWQIENEPNWWQMHEAAGWRKGAMWLEGGTFTEELLDVLNRAVHEEDQSARTIVNLEADAEKLDPSRFARYCDILALDFYPNYKRPEPIDVAPFGRAEQVREATGKPVFVAETGYPSGPGILGYSEQRQAEYVEAVCRRLYSMDGVNGMGIWRYIDGPWRSFPDQENHFGLIDGRGRQKEAWSSYQRVVGQFK